MPTKKLIKAARAAAPSGMAFNKTISTNTSLKPTSDLQYTVEDGDNLISIARKFGLNSLDELLELNPEITNPRVLTKGQQLRLPAGVEAHATLPAATVTASAPADYSRKDFAQLPQSVQQKVAAYAQAVKDGKMKFNDVPSLYQQHVYNQGIRNATTTAAPYVAKWVLGAPWSVLDTIVRGTANEARKGVKRVVTGDKSEGDYGVQDYFGNFSVFGKNFEQKHPVADFIGNLLFTPTVALTGERAAARAIDGTLGQTARVAANNARANAQGTVRTLGIGQPQPVTVEARPLSGEGGAFFKSGSKGGGKTGTATRFSRGGYEANASGKGTFKHEASYAPKVELKPRTKTPVGPYPGHQPYPASPGNGFWPGFLIPVPPEGRVPYVITEPERETHIEETVPTNRWIYNTTPSKVTVPYRQGMENPTYFTGEAPRGGAVEEQPITKESIKTGEGRVIRRASEQPGRATGTTPSGMYSGYGFTYGPEGGALIYRP